MRKFLFKRALFLVLILFILTLVFHFHLHPEHDGFDHCLLCQTLSTGFTLAPFIKLVLNTIIITLILFSAQVFAPENHFQSYQLRAPPSYSLSVSD